MRRRFGTAGLYYHAHRGQLLADKDTIVLADFANTTGDPVFDHTLRLGLSAELDQSPFLNVLSDERIGHTLSLMAQPSHTTLTSQLANEVCQRTASAATIGGSIASLGNQYIQQMLGHSNLESTQVYTRVSIRNLKQIHKATHPGAVLDKKKPAVTHAETHEEAQRKADLLAALDIEGDDEATKNEEGEHV